MNETTLRIAIGFGGVFVGIAITVFYFRFKILLDMIFVRMDEVENKIPTPEEMAKQILSVKLPLNQLPPALMEEIKREAETLNKKNKIESSYIG